MLKTLLLDSGPIMPVLLVTGLVGYVLAWERLMVWFAWTLRDRPLGAVPHAQALRARLDARGPDDGRSPLISVLLRAATLTGVERYERESLVQDVVLMQLPRVNARIATIGWLGTILPMLGLLGTVSGMIATFQGLALTSSRQVLSQGLSEALWTTEVGLLGALPLLAVHHVLSRLRERWFNRLERLVALLSNNGRRITEPEAAGNPVGTASASSGGPDTTDGEDGAKASGGHQSERGGAGGGREI